MKRIAWISLTLLGLLLPALAGQAEEGTEVAKGDGRDGFGWPGGARAAVCLTYDDGLDGHLDIAAPDLESFGLRGTFYVSGHSDSLRRRTEEWRQLAQRGHELGNHGLFHPCLRQRESGEVYEWVKPEYDLDSYTVTAMVDELRVASTLLKAVDSREQRTFAYTCSDTKAGGESFVDAIRPLFAAARHEGLIAESVRGVDTHLVPAWSAEDRTGQQLIAYIEAAAERGTLAVLLFHSVGGGYLDVSRTAHRELLQHLADNRERLWTDTFLNVMQHISSERQRLGWESRPE